MDPAQQPGLDRALRDPQGLEDPERAVLEDVGQGAVAVEQPQYPVDLGRQALGHRLDLLDVLLEDRRRRQTAGQLADVVQEPAGLGQDLVVGQRQLLAAHHRLVAPLEVGLGPQHQLVQRGLAVEHAHVGGGDLALEDADLAAAQPTHQRDHAGAPGRGQGPHQVEDAVAVAEIAGDDGAVAALAPGQQPADHDDVADVRRLEQDLVGAGLPGLAAADAVADVEHRRVGAARAGRGQAGDQRARRGGVVGAGDDQADVGVEGDAGDRAGVDGDHGGAFTLEAEANRGDRAWILLGDHDFGNRRHDGENRPGV
ncbi:MAG: hypothetical protein H6709_14665 [Kofleriaceae bacterium]|nr:hypothetical protein [Kofleriaceae bacterium]